MTVIQINDDNQSDKTVKNYTNVEFEDAVEQTGFGKFNVHLILVCGLCLFASNTECYSVGFIVPSAACEWNLNNTTKGILTSTSFTGIAVSCIIWGYISDIKGRRKLLMFSFLFSFLTSATAALVPSFWAFVALRFFNGLCISGPSAIIFAYFGEFQDQKSRSKAMSYVSWFIGSALISMPALGWLLLNLKLDFNVLGLNISSWRTYMLVNSLPNLIAVIGLSQLWESPKYLYHIGRTEEALEILKSIYSINTGKPKESFPIISLSTKIVEFTSEKKSILFTLWKQIQPLFKSPLLLYTLAGCLMQAGLFALSSGLYLWYPDIINQLSNGDENSGNNLTVCQALGKANFAPEDASRCEMLDKSIFIQNIIVGCIYFVGYASWGVVVNTIGNKNFYNFCMITSSIGIILLCFIKNKILVDIIFVVAISLPGICVTVVCIGVVNVFPTNLCGIAVSMTLTAGRLGSIISSSIVGLMLEWDCTTTFCLYSFSLIVCFLLAFVFPKQI